MDWHRTMDRCVVLYKIVGTGTEVIIMSSIGDIVFVPYTSILIERLKNKWIFLDFRMMKRKQESYLQLFDQFTSASSCNSSFSFLLFFLFVQLYIFVCFTLYVKSSLLIPLVITWYGVPLAYEPKPKFWIVIFFERYTVEYRWNQVHY